MSEDLEMIEGLFGEPEELPVTAPPPPAEAPEAVSLEGILEEVEVVEAFLRDMRRLRNLLCPERARYDAFIVDGDLVLVDRWWLEEGRGRQRARELRDLARRHARPALFVRALRAAGCLPPDVIVVDYPRLLPLSLSQIHAAVFGATVALFNLRKSVVAYPLGEELVGFFLGEGGTVEEVELVLGELVAGWLTSTIKGVLADACLQHHLRGAPLVLLRALRLADRRAQPPAAPQP